MDNKLLEYITSYSNTLEIPKSDVMYNILTGSIPAYTGAIDSRHIHDLWLHPGVRKQLEKIAKDECMSVSALIRNTVSGKHAPLKLKQQIKEIPKDKPYAIASVYAPVAVWVSKVTRALSISQSSLMGQCLRDNKCFSHICAWPELCECKKYSTISMDRELYNLVKATRMPGQSLAYTLYKMLGAAQKPAAPEATIQDAADKAEDRSVLGSAQDPAIMLADLRARCRELLLEVMEQEFERIRKTITRI